MALSISLDSLLEPSLFGDGTWLDYITIGALWTIGLTLCSFALALVLGTLIGTLRTSKIRPVRLFCEAWIELFRNIPLIVQIFIWYFVMPELIPPYKAWMITTAPENSQFFSAFICLGLFTSSRIAEQVRAGISSLPPGMSKAATALGLTTLQSYRYVILPMALRIVIPPITSEAMNMVKNTAVAMTIGLPELTMRANEMGENTFHFFAAYTWATFLYVLISISVNRIMAWIERRSQVPGFVVKA